jgi:predicted ATPase
LIGAFITEAHSISRDSACSESSRADRRAQKDFNVDEIRIENLRSLKDTGYIKLKNINIFLGQNSSGKSTFVRTLPLLKQSLQEKTKSGILWYGKYVDFGSFKEATCNSAGAAQQTINFTFVINDLQVVKENLVYITAKALQKKPSSIKPGRVEITAKISKDNQRHSEYSLKIKNHSISIAIAGGMNLEKFEVDGFDFLSKANFGYTFYLHYGLLPVLLPQHGLDATVLDADLQSDLLKEFSQFDGVSDKALEGLTFESCDNATALSKALGVATEFITEDLRQQASRYVLIRSLPFVWDSLRDHINDFTNKVQYVTPIRASAERYYRIQGLSVEELDPQGTNLAMFLHSLSATQAKAFSEWTQKHMGFSVNSKNTEGHVSILISDKDNKKINMADTGFGFSQVVPILAQIWKSMTSERRSSPAYYVIEQPELHLHPKMQARLADILIAAVKAGKNSQIKLIIETHSETFINQLGKAIDKDLINQNDVGIYLFDKHELDGTTTITESEFDEQGFLTKWPYGFFDS